MFAFRLIGRLASYVLPGLSTVITGTATENKLQRIATAAAAEFVPVKIRSDSSDHKITFEYNSTCTCSEDANDQLTTFLEGLSNRNLGSRDNERQVVQVVEINCGEFSLEFLTDPEFYTKLNQAQCNIFIVHVVTTEPLAEEDSFVEVLQNVGFPLIVQIQTRGSTTTVFIHEPGSHVSTLELQPLQSRDKSVPCLTVEELECQLANKETFSLSLVIKAVVQAGIGGKFESGFGAGLLSIVFDGACVFDGWRLIDSAVFHDNLLCTQFLGLFDWDFSEEVDGEILVERAARYLSVETFDALLGNRNMEKVVNLVNPSTGNTALLTAAKYDRHQVLAYLISQGSAINHRNNLGLTALSVALDEGCFESAFVLIKADALFPDLFLDHASYKLPPDLKAHVEERETFHRLIRKGHLNRIRKEAPLLFDSKSKARVYMNTENCSALATALDSMQYETYAFLASAGFELRREEENSILRGKAKLAKDERRALNDALAHYFVPMPPHEELHLKGQWQLGSQSHIYHLLSASKYTASNAHALETVTQLYRALDQCEEISYLLRVLEFVEDLEIIFDFEETQDHVTTNGLERHDLDRHNWNQSQPKPIYIAAAGACAGGKAETNSDEPYRQVLAAVAHALALAALQALFDNKGKPYPRMSGSAGEAERKFKTLTKSLLKKRANLLEKLDPILKHTFEREDCIVQGQVLVAAVARMLAYKGRDDGLETLEAQLPKLLEYHADFIIPACKDFIETCLLLRRPGMNVGKFHKVVGDAGNIEQAGIQLQNPNSIFEALPEFLKDRRARVLFLNTITQLISLISVYDALSQIRKGKFLVLQLARFLEYKAHIANLTQVKVIVLTFQGLNNLSLQELIAIKEFVNTSPLKKFICIAHQEVNARIQALFFEKGQGFLCSLASGKEFAWDDFSSGSKVELLSRQVQFQGNHCKLGDLLQAGGADGLHYTSLDRLVAGEEIVVHPVPLAMDDLPDCFTRMHVEVTLQDLTIAVQSAIAQRENLTCIISGCGVLGLSDKVLNHATRECIEAVMGIFPDDLVTTNKKLLVTDEEFDEIQFKAFCLEYSGASVARKSAYWLIWCTCGPSAGAKGLRLTLKCVYNPTFYVEREIQWTQTTEAEGGEFEFLDETSFCVQACNTSLILVGASGAGKSVLMKSLARKLHGINPSRWVIQLDLTFCADMIDGLDHVGECTLDLVVDFLVMTCDVAGGATDKHLTRLLLKQVLGNNVNDELQARRVLVLVDGFDEISRETNSNCKEKLLKILKCLNGVATIWITARSEDGATLATALSVPACKVMVFASDQQLQLLRSAWDPQLRLISSAGTGQADDELSLKFSAFGGKLLAALEMETKENTPLVMRMLGHLFRDRFKMFLLDEAFETTEFDRLELHFPALCSNFVTTCYDLYFEDMAKPKGLSMVPNHVLTRWLEKTHERLAFYKIFGVNKLKELVGVKYPFFWSSQDACVKVDEEQLIEVSKVGLVMCTGSASAAGGKFKFMHLVFAEYFVAKAIVRAMSKKEFACAQKPHMYKFILSEILILPRHVGIRASLDFHLKSQPDLAGNVEWAHEMRLLWDHGKLQLVGEKNSGTILHSAVQEGNSRIAHLILTALGEMSVPVLRDMVLACDDQGKTVLHAVVEVRGTEILRYLLFHLQRQPDILYELVRIPRHVIHMAAEQGYLEGLQLILEALQLHPRYEEILLATAEPDQGWAWNAIYFATAAGHAKVVTCLLQHVTRHFPDRLLHVLRLRNTRNHAVTTALHLATSPEVVRALLRVACQSLSVLEELLFTVTWEPVDGNSNQITCEGSPLHAAVALSDRSDMPAEVALLIVNELLSVQEIIGDESFSQFLSVRNCDGQTAQSLAEFKGRRDIVKAFACLHY